MYGEMWNLSLGEPLNHILISELMQKNIMEVVTRSCSVKKVFLKPQNS